MVRRSGLAAAAAIVMLPALFAAPAAADAVKEGAALYRQMCKHCHGPEMQNSGTSSFDLSRFPRDGADRFYESLKNGKDDMPAMGDLLEPFEIDRLWAYVSSRGGRLPPVKKNTEPGAGRPGNRDGAGNGAGIAAALKGVLRGCLAQNGGVLSYRRHRGGGGVDYGMLEAVAKALDVRLEILWYESEDEEESNPVDEVNAFISHGLCHLAANFPLHRDALAQGPGRSVPLPRYRHRPESAAGTIVDLGRLVASDPYRSTRFVVVLPPGSTLRVRTLADLAGRRILAEQGTVAGAIAMLYGGGLLRAGVDLLPPGPRSLWSMEEGSHDAALIELDKYDNHRKQNRVTRLGLAGYEHRIRYNIALVSTERHADLIAHANRVIARMRGDGSLAKMAQRYGLSHREPVTPKLRGPLAFRELAGD